MTNVPAERIRYGARVAVGGPSGRDGGAATAAAAVAVSPASAVADPPEGPEPVVGGAGDAGAGAGGAGDLERGDAAMRVAVLVADDRHVVRAGGQAAGDLDRH